MKVLTILGTSASLNDDIRKYGIVGDVMAVNRTIMDYTGRIKYAVSVHPELVELFMQYRRIIQANVDDVVVRTGAGTGINTSGLLALVTAQQVGYDEVRVLGLSADSSGHYYDLYTAGRENFESKFPFDNDEWLDKINNWSNVKVASGNLSRLFPNL